MRCPELPFAAFLCVTVSVTGDPIDDLPKIGEVVVLNGWTSHCPNALSFATPDAKLTTTALQLAQACLHICRKTATCVYTGTVFAVEKKCAFFDRAMTCTLVRDFDRMLVGDTVKQFVVQANTTYSGTFDIKNEAYGSAGLTMAVRNGDLVTATACVKLCQIHPSCTVATYNGVTCFLKKVPADQLQNGATEMPGMIAYVPV